MRIFLLYLLIAISSCLVAQTTVTIGTGTTLLSSSNAGAIYRSSATSAFDHSHQYYLYTASELAAAGIYPGAVISKVAWFKVSAFGTVTTANAAKWDIWMKNSTTVPSGTWSSGSITTQSTGATLVYSSTAQVIPATANTWVTLTLSTPFTYDGGSLEIGSRWDCSATSGSPTTGLFSWNGTALSQQVVGGSNSSSAITMTNQSIRPNIQLEYTGGTPPACAQPTALTVTGITVTSANLAWTAPTTPPSVGYEWAVTTSSTPPTSGTAEAGTTASASGLTGGTQYYLHVRSDCGGSGFSAWNTSAAFTTLPANDLCADAIDLATLSSPYSGTTAGATDDDLQTCATGNTSPDIYYYIDVPDCQVLTIGQTANGYDSENYIGYGGTCGTGTQIVCYDDPDTQTNTWANNTGATQRVYWVQDGYSSASDFGTFTLAWSLAPVTVPATCGAATSPANAATGIAVSGNITWAAVAGASNYDVYLDQNMTPTTLLGNATTTTIAYASLMPGTLYYVMIVPKNCAGAATGCTATSFTTTAVPPSCTTITTPANSATNVAISGNITWAAAAGATDYDVFLDLAATPAMLLGNSTTTSIAYAGLTNSTVYYVQIVPKNAIGAATGCPVTSFTTIAPPPSNDNCATPTNINGGGVAGAPTGTPISATSFAATQSYPAIACAGFTGTANDDVFFTFTTDANGGDFTITVVGGSTFDAIVELTASCGGPTLACADATFSAGTETLAFTGAAANTTYIVRVYDYGTTAAPKADDRAAGDFTIAVAGTALPVTLTTFTAKSLDKTNVIEWATATERNTQWHIVERSKDGYSNWEMVGKLQAAGNSTEENEYALEDKSPLAVSYYRLRSVDFDGHEDRSNIVIVSRKTGGFGVTAAYPSPTSDLVNVQFESVEEADLMVRVSDLSGRIVVEQSLVAYKGINQTQLDLTNLASGAYMIQVINGTTVSAPYKVAKQ